MKTRRRAWIVRCPDTEFSLRQIFYSTVRGLNKFKTRRSLSDEYLGIGFQINSLWLIQELNLTRRWAFALRPSTRGIYKFQLAWRWCESVKMSCHAILKNLYEPKMDVILTISFKITAEIEITKHMFCVLLCRRGLVSSFCKVCEA